MNELSDALKMKLSELFNQDFTQNKSSSRSHFYFESKGYDFYLPADLAYEKSIQNALNKVERWINRHKESLPANNVYTIDSTGVITKKS